MRQKISIVIPCYNEQKNLERGVLNEVDTYLSNQNAFEYEVIIVNDASTDNSQNIINKFILTHKSYNLFTIAKGGKPGAVWAGIQKAKYPYVLFTDMDQSTPLSEIEKLLPYIPKYEVVIGSRGNTREGTSINRKIMSTGFRFFRKAIMLSHIDDTQCGFKLIKTDIAIRLFPQLGYFKALQAKEGWRVSAFDVELLFMVEKIGCKIKEVLVSWKNQDESTTKGEGNTRFQKESKQMLSEIVRVKLNDIRGEYEKI